MRHLFEEPVGLFLIIMAIILVAPIISRVFRLPSIVGLILVGMLVGPYGIGLLERGAEIRLLGTVGLIYLMFGAGAEIDLEQFNRVRNRSIIFGFLTFIIPLLMGFLLGTLLGYKLLTSILLGSIFASHTLLAFPIITRLGLVKNEAVSVTVGATIITDIGALLVLAAVAGIERGNLSAWFFVRLFSLLGLYTFLTLWGIPRVGRLFFRRFSGDSVEFQFVLVVIFVAAFFAEAIGMEAMVGAFLAGLALNATLPHSSRVMGRVLFIGESFFIPIFLFSIGMLIDLGAFLADQRAWLVSICLLGVIFGSKFTAAWVTARLFGYSSDGVQVMWGLSLAQAAATLAATLVGVEVGLFDAAIFNGVILMILFTCIASPLIVERFAPRLVEDLPQIESTPIATSLNFKRILIPVANPETEDHLITLASILARYEHGILFPLNVARVVNGQVRGLAQQDQLLNSPSLQHLETEIRPLRRVDTSISQGILHAALENEISLIVMGWQGELSFQQTIFGSVLDEVIWQAQMPVLVGRLNGSINAKRRVILVIPAFSITPSLLENVVHTALVVARAINVSLLIMADTRYAESLPANSDYKLEIITPTQVVSRVLATTTIEDLVLMTTAGSQQRFQSSLGNYTSEIAKQTPASLVVIHYPL